MLTGVQSPLAVPLWTLKIELAASILLPFVTMAAARQPAVIWMTAVIFIFWVWEGHPLGNTLLYLSGFVFGAMIVYNLPPLKRFAPSVALAGFLLMWFGRLMFHAGFEEDYHNGPSVIVEDAGAMMLIWAIAARPEAFSILRHRFLIWLGDISYSLYLVHLSILGLITGFGTERLGLPFMARSGEVATIVAMISTLAVTLLISNLIYRYVEMPMIAAGKTVAKMIERRMPGQVGMAQNHI